MVAGLVVEVSVELSPVPNFELIFLVSFRGSFEEHKTLDFFIFVAKCAYVLFGDFGSSSRVCCSVATAGIRAKID